MKDDQEKKDYLFKDTELMNAYKTCKCCGKEYITEQGFTASTTLVGIQSFAPYNLLSLELRDCSCGTTLARKITQNSNKQLVAA